VGDRISEVIVLCEDDPQARLIRAYLEICGRHGRVSSKVASRQVHGGNVGWVIAQFPQELRACRQRNKRSKTLLIVMVDADDHPPAERYRQLCEQVEKAGIDPCSADDPAVVLIPKRQVETWIRCALGDAVDEEQDCKLPKEPDKSTCRRAVKAIYDWSRPNVQRPAHLIPSLAAALDDWRRIC
jgi:hypothetical protein